MTFKDFDPQTCKTVAESDNDFSCYRGSFGETKSCKTHLDLRIYIRDSCPSDNKYKALVHLDVNHWLLSKAAGCKPWFTLADAGIRSWIAAKRQDTADALICGHSLP